MQRKIKMIFICVLMLLLFTLPVQAKGNEWIYDEPQVISEQTEDYIKNLNEGVFSTYKNKPQLGIMIINELPYDTTIDEYKLEQFNQFGVGTAEENCGMLFVFALNDRKYGFEIGDGFKIGSILRKDLETDFVTSDMKSLLVEEDYDAVVMQIVKHLEQIMADEENGVYEQKEQAIILREQQKAEALEKMNKFLGDLFTWLLAILVFFVIFSVLGVIVEKVYRIHKIKTYLLKEQRYVHLLNENEKTLIKYLYKQYEEKAEVFASFDKCFFDFLHDYYLAKECGRLKEMPLKNPISLYEKHLVAENDIREFMNFELKDLDTIVMEVDKKVARENEIKRENQKIEKDNHVLIHDYVIANASKVLHETISLSELEGKMREYCSWGVPLDEETLKKAFDDELKKLSFRCEYEKFIEENKDTIDSKYFDSSSFYNSLQKTSEYQNYNVTKNYNRAWMMFLLLSYMNNRKEDEKRREEERRIKEEKARLERERRAKEERKRILSMSSFGGGFGGGHSSGGGFSGGW